MRILAYLTALALLSLGCTTTVEDDGGSGAAGSGAAGGGAAGSGGGDGGAACGSDGDGPNETLSMGADPAGGVFTLTEALTDLPEGDGPLRAIIDTDAGAITCTLEADAVPNAVANFVGLARGQRPWLDPATNTWVKRRFYDGLIFHRIIDDFMVQGGDPLGTGTGDAGYKIDDEIVGLLHEAGTLAYANAGPNTNGSQFYITEVKTDWLDGDYTIFGSCEPMETIAALAATLASPRLDEITHE